MRANLAVARAYVALAFVSGLSSSSSESLLLPVGSILNPRCGGLGEEVVGFDALARLASWRVGAGPAGGAEVNLNPA